MATETSRRASHAEPPQDDYATYRDLMDAVRGIRDEVKDMIAEAVRSVRAAAEGHVKGLEWALGKRLENLELGVERRLSAAEAGAERLYKSLDETIRSLPVPKIDVHVPQGDAPKIDVYVPQQERPHVDVHVPEASASVIVNVPELKMPSVHLEVPKMDAPHIDVHVPEYRLPEFKLEQPRIDVHVPPQRRLKKNITYDDYGRPVTIEEVDE